MIKSFRHKGLEAFFLYGTKAGIIPAHAPRLARLLFRLDLSKVAQDMNLPGWNLHPLRGDLTEFWSVSVNGNWRVIFSFDGEDAILVDYLDYH
ncbi:type II toxin-antitoxin system RelE/ParE family toxin [Diaphorobacter aerolatus]|uniref:Type II toxin-antitoxin system RelE/ParE family toxin n=1 Tax=Diaphorobacter aerolatus TaxID=1288495 RepID=A0A7H0GFX5_9BURK|nr:type II toxin-antitoxin system RelE/ParE family toxin [Diaphorobacter aerolatus]QNP47191.1 type II toxin-antitoxin system RelE/ParE family toxin [Diaphorobacter aerolatus]